MQLRITKKDAVIIVIASVSLLAVGVVGRSVLGDVATMIVPVLSTALMLAALFEIYRRFSEELHHTHQQDYRQLESCFSLFFTLKLRLPLPNTRDWAASPDLLKKITEVILSEKPCLVLEASSGVSTLVIAYCLKQLGRGRVISLEHDAKFAAMSRSMISFHGLEDVATIVDAPLTRFERNNQKWMWYDTDRLGIDQPIDLLIVDGPPGNLQKLSRYPALPVLYQRLNARSTIILDDGRREDERKIVALWQEEFSHISSEFIDTEQGAYLIRKNQPDAARIGEVREFTF